MKAVAFAVLGAVTLVACTNTVDTVYTPDNYNRVVDIINDTGVSMTRFYATATGRNGRGADRLDGSVLASGGYMTINFDDGTGACYYNFEAQFADGNVMTASNVNVCAETGRVFR